MFLAKPQHNKMALILFSFLHDEGIEVSKEHGRTTVLNSTQLNWPRHVTLTAKRDQKKGKKATAYQYPLSLI